MKENEFKILSEAIDKIKNYLTESEIIESKFHEIFSEEEYLKYYQNEKTAEWRDKAREVIKEYEDGLTSLYDYLVLPISDGDKHLSTLKTKIIKVVDDELRKLHILQNEVNPNIFLRLFHSNLKISFSKINKVVGRLAVRARVEQHRVREYLNLLKQEIR